MNIRDKAYNNERKKWNKINIRNQCWVILDELDASHNKKDDERADIIEENVNFLIKESQKRLLERVEKEMSEIVELNKLIEPNPYGDVVRAYRVNQNILDKLNSEQRFKLQSIKEEVGDEGN